MVSAGCWSCASKGREGECAGCWRERAWRMLVLYCCKELVLYWRESMEDVGAVSVGLQELVIQEDLQ